jgi:hypothetical protein
MVELKNADMMTDNHFKIVRRVNDYKIVGTHVDENGFLVNTQGYELKNDDYAQTMYLVPYTDNEIIYKDVNNYYRTHDVDVIDFASDSTLIQSNIVRVYLPDMNPSRYNKRLNYYISASTRIGRRNIILYSNVISANDFLASERLKTIGQQIYSNYYEFEILSPFELFFNPGYADFRTTYCYNGPNVTNDSTPIVTISIYAVDDMYGDEREYHNSLSFGSGSTILIPDDYSNMNLDVTGVLSFDSLKFKSTLMFNRTIYSSIEDYFLKNYNMNIDFITKELTILDDDNIYRMFQWNHDLRSDINDDDRADFSITDKTPFDMCDNSEQWNDYDINIYRQQPFIGWYDFINGMYAQCVYKVYSDGIPKMYIKTNRVYITQDEYCFLINNPMTINLNDITMNVENVKIINKIENNVIQIQRPDDYKNNLVKPVFYKAYSADTIVIMRDPNVGGSLKQYISIELPSNVSANAIKLFRLRINGQVFTEVARQMNQIIFLINPGVKVDVDLEDALMNEIEYNVMNEDDVTVFYGKVIFTPSVTIKKKEK